MRLIISEAARADLREVARYSAREWGATRARAYQRDLKAKMALLLEHPGIGSVADEIRPGLQRLPAYSHNIFFRVQPNAVRIVRILHKRMEPKQHIR